jgi:ribosomal-protein-alanine N-acetyltransferase
MSEVSELESVAVSPTARRQGIARALLLAAMAWTYQSGAQSMELEVRSSSEGALALYRSLGFAEQGRRRAYYQNPSEDAILMGVPLQEEVSRHLLAAPDNEITKITKV